MRTKFGYSVLAGTVAIAGSAWVQSFAQSPVAVPVPMDKVRYKDAISYRVVAKDGTIGPEIPLQNSGNNRDVPAWVMSFDTMQWDLTSDLIGSSIYRATPAPFSYLLLAPGGTLYNSPSIANDMLATPVTRGRTAKRMGAFVVWNPNADPSAPGVGPSANLALFLTTDNSFEGTGVGPATAAQFPPIGNLGGLILNFGSVAPGFWILGAQWDGTPSRIPIPMGTGSLVCAIATYSGTGYGPAPGNCQPVFSSQCNAADPFFPGTNASVSTGLEWEDNRNPANTANASDYRWQGFGNTGGIFTELKNNNAYGAAIGSLQGCVSLVIDANNREIRGRVFFTSLVDAFNTAPRLADFQLLNAFTLAVIDSQTTSLDGFGNYILSDPNPAGAVYKVYLKKDTWLGKLSANANTTGGSVGGINLVLINGDVDGDNEITLADYARVALAFGSGPGDGNWNPSADLDRDLEVTLADYAIVAVNFGQAGD